MTEYIDKTEAMRRFKPFGREIPKEQVMEVIARMDAVEVEDDVIRRQDAIEAARHAWGKDLHPTRFIEALPPVSRPKGEWIPLSHDDDGVGTDFPYDRDGEWVIVTDGNTISVERIKKDAYDHFYPNGRWFGLDDVIAWMPLPKPYKERSEE